jgi:hypothetical protein
MRRSVLGAVIIVVSILGVSGGVLVLYNQSAGLHWAVESGTEITYAVRVTGFTEFMATMNASFSLPPHHAELNNTFVTIRIDSLPEIPAFLNGGTFAESILSNVKTSITGPLVYMNGSEVVSVDYLFLNNLLSQSILPVGNWPFIDSLYPDISESDPLCDTYFSSLNTSFVIGHRTYLYDAGSGWSATVDMTTGLPTNATVWASQFYGYTFYSYEITLTPVPSG